MENELEEAISKGKMTIVHAVTYVQNDRGLTQSSGHGVGEKEVSIKHIKEPESTGFHELTKDMAWEQWQRGKSHST